MQINTTTTNKQTIIDLDLKINEQSASQEFTCSILVIVFIR